MKKVCFFLLVLFLSVGPLFAEPVTNYAAMKGFLELLRNNEEEAVIGIDFIEEESGIHTVYPQALILNVYDDCVLFETYYGAFVCVPLDKIRFVETKWKNSSEKTLFDAAAQMETELKER